MNMKHQKIIAIVPCYNVRNNIIKLLKKLDKEVDKIVVIDDQCPEGSYNFIKSNIKSKKLILLKNKTNLGVGGAVIRGYKIALKYNYPFIIKIDGDGQMKPLYISKMVSFMKKTNCDYVKGNRFMKKGNLKQMPKIRIFGNYILSFMGRFSTGYWNIFDFNNGYTLISSTTLRKIKFKFIANNFFFESDLLFYLGKINAKVCDFYIPAYYPNKKSNLKIRKVFLHFLVGHFRNSVKRILRL